jgi:IS5 family transposase
MIAHIIKDSPEDFGWRKHHDWRKRLKTAYHHAAKRSVGQGRNTSRGLNAAMDYLTVAESLSQKMKSSKEMFNKMASDNAAKLIRCMELDYYEKHLDKHIDLVRRRLILSETIPHVEKIFSLFEPHTEWIKKGKAGDKVELGLRIAVASDQYGFIIGHRPMIKEQDVDIAVPFTRTLAEKYNIDSASFDKGFWSWSNHKDICEIIAHVVMPKKGKLNKDEYEREHTRQFKALRNSHAAVESDINCLEHHGLNRCPDKGLTNFRKYTSFGVLAYNLHRLGNLLFEQEREKLSKNKIWAKAA